MQKNKKIVVILLGKKGIKIAVFCKHELQNSIFIDYIDHNYQIIFENFLKNYKTFYVSFLLDSEECQMKHEFMPMIDSIIKFHPVENFIEENYKPEDIVAYNIYNIDHSNGEVWEANVASTPDSAKINKLIEFVIRNGFVFGGVYFLSLEFEPIIDTIIQRKNINDSDNDLQIFITITEVNDIRFASKHKKNILDESIVVFPNDKSDLYLVGTIEQAVTDIILKYKAYVKSLDIKVLLIFVCDQTLADLIFQSTFFQAYKMVTYVKEFREEKSNPHFVDVQIMELFLENKKYSGFNSSLKLVKKFTTINSVFFKPLFFIIIVILIILGSYKYSSINIQKQTIALNNKYYSLAEKYRNMKKNHPDIENITNLADLYNIEALINTKLQLPFDYLQKVLSIKNSNIDIVAINWNLENSIDGIKIVITFDIIYTNMKKDMGLAKLHFKKYFDDVKLVFQENKVSYNINYDDVTELQKKITIPGRVLIE